MKDKIKEILREDVKTNYLGVNVTRPNQVLYILRGISGAGKSTKTKSLVGEGVIHSTDTLIEQNGDYSSFFKQMVESKDFSPLSRMHSNNLKNAINSMKNGITPVLIDNTNIKPNECKSYVKAALELGYSDDNIKFIDIGTGGLTAQQLTERNTHGVPLEKIKSMIDSYNFHGELTIKKVMESKDFYQDSDILYSAVVLDTTSKNKLLDRFSEDIPTGWVKIAHHMTIVFGKGLEDKQELGKEVILKVVKVGFSDMAMAVQVDGYPSKNKIPHITIAINPDGGKPVLSNDITKWISIKPFFLSGKIREIKKTDENEKK